MSKTLFDIFNEHKGDEIYKWNHYFDIYEQQLSKFKNSKVPLTIVEVGILYGGSLQMWQQYFGPNATIVGIDIYEECKKYEKENIKIRIGSQADKNFLEKIVEEFPKIDVLIDDGSHRVYHQKFTYKYLFPFMNDGGIYIVEDTHSSYWSSFGGGLKRSGSFVEFTKRIVDSLHARYSEQKRFKPDYYTMNIRSIHFYDSIICVEKGITTPPFTVKRGVNEKVRMSAYHNIKKSFLFRITFACINFINKILQFFCLPGFILDGRIRSNKIK